MNLNNYIIAIFAGILPALVWLYFWRREDRRRPEPRRFILLAFISGMVAVPIALKFQLIVSDWLLHNQAIEKVFPAAFLTALFAITLWAAIEEVLKLFMASISVLWRSVVDEPIDPMMYLITTGLGFSAAENILFLLNPIMSGNPLGAIITGNLRFVGASLVHIASSAIVGFFITLAFYKPRWIRRLYTILGLILSTSLHTLFNFFIIQSQIRSSGALIFTSFVLIWIAAIVILLVFEKAKRIHPMKNPYK